MTSCKVHIFQRIRMHLYGMGLKLGRQLFLELGRTNKVHSKTINITVFLGMKTRGGSSKIYRIRNGL